MDSTAELRALGIAAGDGAVEKEFVRQYVDNGLAVFDAAGKRVGIVADYDRPGGGFVVHLGQPPSGLYIPLRFVCKVRRGKAYLSELARDVIGHRLDRAPSIPESQLDPLKAALRFLGRVRRGEASA